ncbi:MAG: hypothetical protein K9N49_03470 [Candidatus Marinimicrobia bacterium]|nr:hypothetical protein [Candidatus Neomarinimicrobiota bacterium]
MTPRRARPLLVWAGWGAWLLAGLLLVTAWQPMQRRRAALARKARDLSALRAAATADDLRVPALFEELPAAPPTDPAALVREVLAPHVADVSRHPVQLVRPGWVRHEVEIRVGDFPLERLGALLVALERQAPPWKVTALSLRATGPVAGRGQVTLTCQALTRGEAP